VSRSPNISKSKFLHGLQCPKLLWSDYNAKHLFPPVVVIYVNGIALGVLELKRSTVSVAEGIRQNLDNQKKEFIQPFFSTVQLVLAGNDAEGLRYGAIETKEKYYLTWKESECEPHGQSDPKLADGDASLLDAALIQICNKSRLLEFIHDFTVFDAGIKKLCRHNQYFAVRSAQEFIRRREGGIIWNTQGSGKSLIMVWLAKWIREHVKNSRVLIITDRTELDEQIERIFFGVNEDIYRTKSCDDLIEKLNDSKPWLMCSLIHKFGGRENGEEVGDIKAYIEEVKRALPKDFVAKGDLYVFVDECHRTQSGDLHDAIDLKQYEPAMRHLIDAYIRAEESEPVSNLNDLSLIQLIVERGEDAVKSLTEQVLTLVKKQNDY
jgi:type I restriction enzyme R subunit